uniref:Uncharacterized protein n=1 Tax=Setaria viridis TaxID=4556 RepID=A0A4U6T4B1_SETVI|nr:hypothetical protein SEVIR_9G349650v2 [Setaria viridis]
MVPLIHFTLIRFFHRVVASGGSEHECTVKKTGEEKDQARIFSAFNMKT